MTIHPLVAKVGYYTKTEEIRFTGFTLFVCLTIDMCILPLFLGMNLMEHYDNKITQALFKGKYTDFSSDWYPDVGFGIVITIIIFSFQPLIDFLVEYAIWWLYREYYRAYVYNPRNDSQTYKMNVSNDFLRYIDLYAGPAYEFHYKTANTNLIVFTSLIFGPMFPVLYFVALYAIGVQYVTERLTLTYFYRLPPKFSEELTLLNIKIMKVAPFINLIFTTWLYTN